MSSNRKSSESDLIRLYNMAFSNTEANPAIGDALTATGYNAEQIANGKKLLKDAENLHKQGKAQRERMAAAYEEFSIRRAMLEKTFGKHHRLSKIALRNHKLMRDKLSISGKYTTVYGPWIASASKFYGELAANPEILQKLAIIGITEADVQNGNQQVEQVIATYSLYVNLKGESQKTTVDKRIAFQMINEWMSDFYAVAKIAFKSNPQQIESFGIVTKS